MCFYKPDALPVTQPATINHIGVFKGELNPKIKLDLNDSFCPLINITLIYSNFAWFKRNFPKFYAILLTDKLR